MTTTAGARPDPTLIRGIYHYCDQWCVYCPATARCLAFRCLERRAAMPDASRGLSFEDAMEVTRELLLAEGRSQEEVAAYFAEADGDAESLLDDPLAVEARTYARQAYTLLISSGWLPPASPPARPTAFDVIAWYHVMIAARVVRALGAATRERAFDFGDDPDGCAKVALVAVDRSRKALRQLAGTAPAPRLAALGGLLERLGVAIEQRFPRARDFVRPGLDAPST